MRKITPVLIPERRQDGVTGESGIGWPVDTARRGKSLAGEVLGSQAIAALQGKDNGYRYDA